MGLTADQRIIVAIVISFTAYGLGRNLLIYFVLSWLNPFLGAIVLAVRHMAKPADGSKWIYELVARAKLRLWSRKMKPDDFEDPKN